MYGSFFKGLRMVEVQLNFSEPLNEGNSVAGSECYILLMKDTKPICRTRCHNPPIPMPPIFSICDIVRPKSDDVISGSPQCVLVPAAENSHQQKEWGLFLGFLQKQKRVAIVKFESYEFYISPPNEGSDISHAVVSWPMGKTQSAYAGHVPLEKNHVPAHPSYLKTLGQAHSGWMFGAIAELVDNSRDAKANKLEVSIEMVYSTTIGIDIPMLSVIDDGHGMTHLEILGMISLGHKQPDANDPNHIGRFGVGFKTGAMRLGKDALVITQTANSRSIAFLSQSLNEGKENLEIPIVSYHRRGQIMEEDTTAQTEALAKLNLKAIKEFSPFNEYLIGQKSSLFHEKGTGTQIYIWNLDKWGSNYCLEWQTGRSGGSSFHHGDILIRSRRIRSRPGQTSLMVPLDYSLRAYLEVIFLDPRMKLYVQGSPVRSRPLAKSLSRTVVEDGTILRKPVQLIMGLCQLEWEQANCGIFLYWHGRLIEAYKRVGGMIHSADTGRGIIGVMDVTDLMNDGEDQEWVHNNKQGFQDCELYARLEEWLGSRFDKYWDDKFDKLDLEKGSPFCKPDHEWVQCDKCRKWRMLDSGFDIRQLPQQWFCYMDPFNERCEFPEQEVERGVVTLSAKRSRHDPRQIPAGMLEGIRKDDSAEIEEEDGHPSSKRPRRGPPRVGKKTR